MNTTTPAPRPPLSTIDRSILALHALAAAVLGTVAFVGADDPEFGSLQRVLVVMLIGLWAAGIVAMGVAARFLKHQWSRIALLAVGPFVGIAALVVKANLG